MSLKTRRSQQGGDGIQYNMRVRRRLIGFVIIIQSVLFLTHFVLYKTWTFSPSGGADSGTLGAKLAFGFLSVSFVAASLLAFRYTNAALRAFYRVAAVWLGLLTFLFFAAIFSWIIYGVALLARLDLDFHRVVELLFGASIVAGFTEFLMRTGHESRERQCDSPTCRQRGMGEEQR